MLIIASSLALLVIYAGTKLAIQVRLNAPGRLYIYLSWFLVVMGFLLLLGTGAMATFRCCQVFSGMHRGHCTHANAWGYHKGGCGGEAGANMGCDHQGRAMCRHGAAEGAGMSCRHAEMSGKCCMEAMGDHGMMKDHVHHRDSLMKK